MQPSDSIRPHGQLEHGLLVDVVRAVEADDGGEECPGAEGAGAEGGDLGRDFVGGGFGGFGRGG